MARRMSNKCTNGCFLSLLFVLNFTVANPAAAQQGRAALLLALNSDLQTLAGQTKAFYPAALTQYPIMSHLLTAALMFDALGGLEIEIKTNALKSDFFAQIASGDSLYLIPPLKILEQRSASPEELAIFFAALLEVNGIRTALIEAKGRPLVAFDTGVPARYSEAISKNKAAYVIKNYHVWLPVEVAYVGQPLNKAWQAAQKRFKQRLFDVLPVWDVYRIETGAKAVKNFSINEKTAIRELYLQDKLHFENEQNQTVLARTSKVLRENQDKATVYMTEGLRLLNQKDYDAAIAEFKKSIEIAVDIERALFLIAKAVGEKKQYNKMFKIGQALQKLNNRSSRSYKILGYASLRLGKIHEGNSFFEQAKFIEKNLELVESSDAAQEALTNKAFK